MLALLIRLTPIWGLSAMGTALGYHLLTLIPVDKRAYILIPFSALFLALNILIQEAGWNLVLLLGFSITSGLVLNWTGAEVDRWGTWVLFLSLITAALIGAQKIGRAFQRNSGLLILLIALFLVGWLGIGIYSLPGWIQNSWLICGLIAFAVILAILLWTGLSLKKEENQVPLGIELSIVLINLFWLSSLIILR